MKIHFNNNNYTAVKAIKINKTKFLAAKTYN